jgi:hypothetical protein
MVTHKIILAFLYVKILFGLVLSAALIMATSTSIFSVNTVAAQEQTAQQQAQPRKLFTDFLGKILSGQNVQSNAVTETKNTVCTSTRAMQSIPLVGRICNTPTDNNDKGNVVLTPSPKPTTPPQPATTTPLQKTLEVSFRSIRINDDHDNDYKVGICPFCKQINRDGDWKIGVIVNGQLRGLLPPPNTVKDGGTYSLSQVPPIVVTVGPKGALFVNTVGLEIDNCNGFNFPKIPPAVTTAAAGLAATGIGAPAAAVAAIAGYATQIKAVSDSVSSICNLLISNDAIGTINDRYDAPTFGVGVHTVTSTPYRDSGRDFVLTYEIRAR